MLTIINMVKQNKEFFWGDKWSIEKGTGWYVSGNNNILFCVDMESDNYHVVKKIPDEREGFRLYPNCIKCDDVVFCMPNTGKCIWYYKICFSEFWKIEVTNPNYVGLGIIDYWKCGEVLWAVSKGLKQIVEINIKERIVMGYYDISKQKQEEIGQSIMSKKGKIYIVSTVRSRIYEFDTVSKEIKINEILQIKGGLRTIVEYNGKFWLSGYKKEIYVWDRVKNKIEILYDFPEGFGIYNFEKKIGTFLDCDSTNYDVFTFLTSSLVGEYIWFIPYQTNQILYVSKKSNEINVFEIEDENEDGNSIFNREIIGKYILQYIHEDRYIGLYSLKNEIVLEIDAKEMVIKRRNIVMDDKNLEEIFPGTVLREGIYPERVLYNKFVRKNMRKKIKKENRGIQIYNSIND